MDTFSSLDGLWYQAVGRVIHEGQRLDDSIEVLGYAARLDNVRENWLWSPVRSASATYAAAELLHYLGGANDSANDNMLGHYNGAPNTFHRETAEQCNRWRTHDQLRTAYDLLRVMPNSRRCVTTCLEPTDLSWALAGTRSDLPYACTLKFYLRDRHLYCIADMMSNDVWWRMPYDVWVFSSIQRLLAEALDVEPGWYQHQAATIYLQKQDFEAVNFVEEYAPEDSSCWRAPMDEIAGWGPMEAAIRAACSIERASREQPGVQIAWTGEQTFLNECAALVAKYNKVKEPSWLNRNLLR